MYDIKRAKRLSHALVHSVIARASLFTDHAIAGLPMRAKYRPLKNVRKPLAFLQQIPFRLPSIGGRQSMEWRLCRVVELFCSPVRIIVPHISLHDHSYRRTMRKCLRHVFQKKKVAFL